MHLPQPNPNQTEPKARLGRGWWCPMEHMLDMMMLMALGGDVMYGWKENFWRCAITASSF